MSLATVFNYLANSLWQVPLLAFCCWCGLRLMRTGARVQYGVWVVTLLLCVGVPLRNAKPPVVAVQAFGEDIQDAGAFLHPLPRRAVPFYEVRITPHTRDLLAEGYLLLTGFFLLRLLVSHASLRRLVRTTSASSFSDQQRDILVALGTEVSQVRILPSQHRTPMVAGVLRPWVLLPAALLQDDVEAFRAVLAHELAHVRRRDTAANLLLRALALPIAYHPATALIHRKIQHARELLCDSVAAEALPSAGAYAQVLLRLAGKLIHTGGDTSGTTVGLFASTSKPLLEERIMNLIAPPAPLRTASRVVRFAAGAAVFGAAAATISLVHLTPSVLAAEQPVRVAQTLPAQAVVPDPAAPTGPAGAKAAPPASPHQKAKRAEETDAANAMTIHQTAELQRQIAEAMKAEVDTAGLRKQMEELRARMNSPEFKQQLQAASQVDLKALTAELAELKKQNGSTLKAAEEVRKQAEEIRKQIDTPEFRRQIAEAARVSILSKQEMAKLIAETQALPALTAELHGPAAAQDPHTPRVSGGIMAGQIESRVQPVYPPDAKAAGISGAVVMRAIIGKDGTVSKLEVISGPQELQASAVDAVRQWVYKPYLLNGQPTEVETTITVNYSFGG